MTQIFVNITANDIDRAKAFYTALGTTLNPNFSDDETACVVWDDSVYFMILSRDRFADFTEKEIIDPRESVQTLIALSRDSRDDVDAILAAGLAAGGSEPREPQDLGFMYSRALDDPSGNTLEFLWMDPAAAESGPPAE